MSTAPTAPAQTNPPAPDAPQPRRRDLLVGALGGVLGLTGGLAAGGVLNRKPRTWVGDKVIPAGAKVSYAQFADDLVSAHLFNSVGIEKPTYLDIGAFDPVSENNTYLFYLAGSRGVLVEPNKAITERLKSVRPGDTVLVAGIGTDETPEADYFMLDNPGLNTFDREQAERIARETPHKIREVVKMPLLNINKVIAENFGGKAPDLISIDIEGLDFAVLNTLDFKKYRPKLVCAETLITNTLKHNPATTKLFTDNGYEVRGMTVANTFYVDKSLLPV
jgi:FkbM family methyltransferase